MILKNYLRYKVSRFKCGISIIAEIFMATILLAFAGLAIIRDMYVWLDYINCLIVSTNITYFAMKVYHMCRFWHRWWVNKNPAIIALYMWLWMANMYMTINRIRGREAKFFNWAPL